MKKSVFVCCFLMNVWSPIVLASTKTWGSAYTDIQNDCVQIAEANDSAPIDFANRECKAFGGYQLNISGGDLRYGPNLTFGGNTVYEDLTPAFHDTAANKVEWMYLLEKMPEGDGQLQWLGFIYRLSVQSLETGKDEQRLYVVRLNGVKSCLLGTVRTNEEARSLVRNLSAPCQGLN